jgi:L-lactate dehydrogenase complex protein LldG
MIDRFQASAHAAGATVRRLATAADALPYLRELAGGGDVCASQLPPRIGEALAGMAFAPPVQAAEARLCVSFARAGIARTGSLLLELPDPRERGATALPLLHAVFLRGSTIVPDLSSLHDLLARELSAPGGAYLSITTGPSRTADIERVLTIGVHGPRELHVLVLEGE